MFIVDLELKCVGVPLLPPLPHVSLPFSLP
jgi:hypothetical protein